MNIYDTKSIVCARCETFLGEVDYDAKIIHPLCGKCANPLPEGDKILYTMSKFISQHNKIPERPILAA